MTIANSATDPEECRQACDTQIKPKKRKHQAQGSLTDWSEVIHICDLATPSKVLIAMQ